MIPEIESRAETRKTGHRWIDISAALCALVVSITSLGIAVLHGHTMERMADANARLVSANSWPILMFFTSNATPEGDATITWNVSNAGVGPAKIETAEMLWRGRAVRSVNEMLRECCGLGPDQSLLRGSLQGTVLRAGETISVLRFPRTPQNESTWRRLNEGSIGANAQLRVCYCSVFDECWLTDFQTLRPKSVQQCPVPPVAFTQ